MPRTKKNAKAQPVKSATRGRGRPRKDGTNGTPSEIAVADLQYALDRANNFVMDGGASMAARAARCARAGVPRSLVNKAIEALESAVADLREAVDRAYSEPEAKAAPVRRVDLTA